MLELEKLLAQWVCKTHLDKRFTMSVWGTVSSPGRSLSQFKVFFLKVSTIVDYDNSRDRLLRSSRLWQGGTLCSLTTSTLIKRLKARTGKVYRKDSSFQFRLTLYSKWPWWVLNAVLYTSYSSILIWWYLEVHFFFIFDL